MLVLFHLKAKGNVVRFYFTDGVCFSGAEKMLASCKQEDFDSIVYNYTDMTIDAHFDFDVEVNDAYVYAIKPLIVFGKKHASSDSHDIVVGYDYGNSVSEVMVKLDESMGIVDNFEIVEG